VELVRYFTGLQQIMKI